MEYEAACRPRKVRLPLVRVWITAPLEMLGATGRNWGLANEMLVTGIIPVCEGALSYYSGLFKYLVGEKYKYRDETELPTYRFETAVPARRVGGPLAQVWSRKSMVCCFRAGICDESQVEVRMRASRRG